MGKSRQPRFEAHNMHSFLVLFRLKKVVRLKPSVAEEGVTECTWEFATPPKFHFLYCGQNG